MANLPGAPRQRTLRREILLSGIGLHTGREGTLRIGPAAPGEGLVFFCQGRRVPALAENVAPSARCTRLAADGAEVLTPEHWAFAGTGIYYGDLIGADSHVYGYEVDGLDFEIRGGELQAPTLGPKQHIPEDRQAAARRDGPSGDLEPAREVLL